MSLSEFLPARIAEDEAVVETMAALRREVGPTGEGDGNWRPMIAASEVWTLLDALAAALQKEETMTYAEKAQPRCREFWRYTGQGEAPEHVALECNVHGVIPGITAADPEERVIDAWADHIACPPDAPQVIPSRDALAEAWDEGAAKARQYRDDLDLSPLNPYRGGDAMSDLSPEQTLRDRIEAVLRLSCHHCGLMPDVDGDHSCDCPSSDSECLRHTMHPVAPLDLIHAALADPGADEKGAMTLTEFLLARIAEDEYAAGLTFETCFVGTIEGRGSRYDLALRMSPTRVLAECEAKRQMVQMATELVSERCDYSHGVEGRWTLRDLGAVYADHPDYREEWKP